MAIINGNSFDDFVHVVGDGKIPPTGFTDIEKATHQDDQIRTSLGDDIVHAGGGADLIEVAEGNDTVDASFGDDTVIGSDGNDSIEGKTGDDVLWGYEDSTINNLGEDDDTLKGGWGDDTLIGGDGSDEMFGGAGADVFVLDLLDRVATGTIDQIFDFNAAEGDRLDVSELNIASEATLRAISVVAGNALTGYQVTINRSIYDKQQTLVLNGVDDVDALFANAIYSTDTTASTNLNPANVYLSGSNPADLFGGLGDDVMYTNSLAPANPFYYARLFGGEGNDTITGSVSNEFIIGGTGADVIDGGGGSDIAWYAGANGVTVDLALGTGSGSDAQGDVLIDIADLIGSDASDRLYGNDDPNHIEGSAGDDLLQGQGGDDILFGDTGWLRPSNITYYDELYYLDSGNDTILGGDGNDTINGGLGNDDLSGNQGDDQIAAGPGDDTVNGNAGNDALSAVSGDNILFGNGGDDVFSSGTGNDTMTGGNGGDVFTSSSNVWGDDVIDDFQQGIDEIDLGAYVTDFSQLNSAVSVAGGDTVIDLALVSDVGLQGSLTLDGFSAALLASDFGL